jgi:hypothetical protein
VVCVWWVTEEPRTWIAWLGIGLFGVGGVLGWVGGSAPTFAPGIALVVVLVVLLESC